MADITTDNINTIAQNAASIGDGDYIFIYKAGSNAFSKIEKNVFMAGAGGGSGSDSDDESESITASFVGEKLVITNANVGTIKLSTSSVVFPDTEEGDTRTATFVVTGKNLTSGISLTLNDSSGMFSISPSSISAANANSSQMITVTYAPTAIGDHDAIITLVSGDISTSVELSGFAVEEIVPSILINYGESIPMFAEVGETVTLTVPVAGRNLSANATLSVTASGSGFSVTPNVLTADANGMLNDNITLSYTAGSSSATGTVTVSGGGATGSSTLTGNVRSRLAEGSYWKDGNGFKFTVLGDTTNVSVVADTSVLVGGSQFDLTIPATASDLGKTVYDSNGNVIESSGMVYNVTSIGMLATSPSPKGAFEAINFRDVVVSEGITSIGARAFFGTSGEVRALNSIVLPSTLKTWGIVSNASWALRQRSLKKVVIKGTTSWANYISNAKTIEWFELGENVTTCNAAAYFYVKSGGKVIVRTASVPTLGASFFESDTKTNATLYVKDELIASFAVASGWSGFTTIKGISELE